jgi:cold shock CspA family protein
MRQGSVTEFDESRGLGEVTDETGTVFSFHCVEITDGSRTIATGMPVRFDVIVKFGRHEAARIVSWTNASAESST